MAKDGDSINMSDTLMKTTKLPRLVIATHNKGKLREFRELLAPYVDVITSSGELGLPEPEETGTTFEENALLKARIASSLSGSLALADDSGLCVNALGGDPGLLSARWAGPTKDFDAAMKMVNDRLGAARSRSAHFIAVLALVGPGAAEVLFEGKIFGTYIWPPRGTNGHGYDPAFQPDGVDKTFAELDDASKNAISHRGLAVQKFIAYLKTHKPELGLAHEF